MRMAWLVALAARVGSTLALAALMGASAGGTTATAIASVSIDPAASTVIPIDDFEETGAWSAHPADGVELKLGADSGLHGRSLRADFKFVRGGGYAVMRRAVSLDLPANYEFRFHLRGACRPNNLEFKLIDSTGENVWWSNQRDFHFPARWDSVRLKRRQIQFAWGPAGGGEIRHVAAIEIAITAGSGGEGSVWLDDLVLEPLPPVSAPSPPVARASSSRAGHGVALAVDADSSSFWWNAPADVLPTLTLDLGGEREFGGLSVDWAPGRRARDVAFETSSDGTRWERSREIHGGRRPTDDVFMPESEARFVRVRVLAPTGGAGVAIRGVTVRPLEWGASLETFFGAIASGAPRGTYPRGISGEQTRWTLVGVDGGRDAGLLGEDGALESETGSFSIEPFLADSARLITWSDVTCEHTLEDGCLPMPSVRWNAPGLLLTITAFADGERAAPRLRVRYRVTNTGSRRRRVTLELAFRPFQVNPPTQFLNRPGGTARIATLRLEGRSVIVNGERRVTSLLAPSGFGAEPFGEEDIAEDLRRGRLPLARSAADPFEHASGALAYALDLAPGAERQVDIVVIGRGDSVDMRDSASAGDFDARFAARRALWRERLSRVQLSLQDSDLVRTLRSQLAFILVNRRGAALQPGPRSYARSWIRDGALAAAALLRLGLPDVVRDYITWFAPYQFADGRVPCCVDQRGADPVPELDSNGEFIYLVAEYVRLTGDHELGARIWPAVSRAVASLDSLRAQRRTAEWSAPGREAFRGLLPPSISHEGYSAKPMHSYWDDFFALRGYRDAAWLAAWFASPGERGRIGAARDQFQSDLAASVVAARALHHIDYVPGCADLGDFDATSTAIGVSPLELADVLPADALARTFERYWDFFRDRRDGKSSWEALTPYEVRLVGAFVRLGWRERANELLRYFMGYRRPAGWAQWAEVVWHDERAPKFIGDMPHTWVGSEFVRSVVDMLAYERERDDALVLAAGVPTEWARAKGGVAVHGLPTRYGPLGYTLAERGDSLTVKIESGLLSPPGGIAVRAPGRWSHARVNGVPAAFSEIGEVVVRELPASLILTR